MCEVDQTKTMHKNKESFYRNSLFVGVDGFEPPTLCL